MESIEFLEDSLKRGIDKRRREISSVYGSINLWGNPFKDYAHPLYTNFKELFVGRTKEIEKISEHLVESLSAKGEDLAIIGAYGCGARSIINLFQSFLEGGLMSPEFRDSPEYFEAIRNKIHAFIDIPLSDFTKNLRERYKISISEALSQKKMSVVTSHFSDDCDMPILSENNKFDERTLETYRKILEFDRMAMDKILFISPWTSTGWYYTMEESPMLRDVYEEQIFLEPLSAEECADLLEHRLRFFSLTGSSPQIFTKNSLKEVATFSGGIPRFALEFSSRLLENELAEAKKNRKTDEEPKVSLESFENLKDTKFVKKRLQNIEGMPPSYEKIKEVLIDFEVIKSRKKRKITQKESLRTMIGLGGRDVTATQISRYIGKTRPAISKAINELEGEGLIYHSESERDARAAPVTLYDFVRAVFENEIVMKEIKEEFN
jgi:DNA-binding MarR family transcriptional regulator